MYKVLVKKLDKNAVIPSRAHDNDAGFDMVATRKNITEKYVEYGTGIAMHIPDGHVGLLFPRSSVTKKDLILKNSVGVIDAGYRGEISFRFYLYGGRIEQNISNGFFGKIKLFNNWYCQDDNWDMYEVGDKIGQIIIIKLPKIEMVEIDDLEESERGTGGYGSTDIPKPPPFPKGRTIKEGEIPKPPPSHLEK